MKRNRKGGEIDTSALVDEAEKLFKKMGNMRQACRIVAKQQNGNAETIRKALLRKHQNEVQLDRRQIFSDQEEAALVGLITSLSSSGRLLTKTQVITIARKFGNLKKNGMDGAG